MTEETKAARARRHADPIGNIEASCGVCTRPSKPFPSASLRPSVRPSPAVSLAA